VSAWKPELVVDEALARRLLAQFAELEPRSLRLIGEGWDNTVWLLDGNWVFRFPRREVVLPGIENEISLLPRLAPQLPLPIPVPRFVGRPNEEFPWPFFGSAFLPGREPGDAGLDDEGRVQVARDLMAFLHVLHATELDAELPVDPTGRADMEKRIGLARVDLAALGRLDEQVESLFAEAEALPPPGGPLVLAHGDLHFRHVLVEGGRGSGVIDWIDLCRADRCIDLSLLWSLVPPGRRSEVLAEYGELDEEQLLRARVLAIQLCAVLARYGADEGNAAVEREALEGLARALDGETLI
jgi:aminoglycoside phosphotransferase (APT) family kinase protein